MATDPDAERRLADLVKGIIGPPATPPPMPELLAHLDRLLRELRPDYYSVLQHGLTDAEWEAFRSRLGLDLPDGFRLLYQWKNGQRDNCSDNILGNYMFVAADSVAETKELHDSMIGYDFEPGWWERTWVPFLHNGGGDHMCLDVGGSFGGRPGQLVEFWHDWEKRAIAAPSLEHWVLRVVNSLDPPPPDNRHPETDTGPPVGREIW